MWYNTGIEFESGAVLLAPAAVSHSGVNTMTEQIVSQKTCRLCNGDFPATSEFFYQHSESKDGLHGHCKACAKKRARTYNNKPKGRPNEILLVNYLLKKGIFADVGAKLRAYKFADVVAWGCIKIEMKYSWSDEETHKFQFTPRQLKLNGAGVDVICLATEGMGEIEYHFFDAKDPFFYRGGKLKASFSYIPYASHRKGKEVLMPEVMDKAKDNVSIIECYRQQVASQLLGA